jgi:hypothetical protein
MILEYGIDNYLHSVGPNESSIVKSIILVIRARNLIVFGFY